MRSVDRISLTLLFISKGTVALSARSWKCCSGGSVSDWKCHVTVTSHISGVMVYPTHAHAHTGVIRLRWVPLCRARWTNMLSQTCAVAVPTAALKCVRVQCTGSCAALESSLKQPEKQHRVEVRSSMSHASALSFMLYRQVIFVMIFLRRKWMQPLLF